MALSKSTTPEMKSALYVSAPGKVILHGEHAVVYGKTALAASLNLRTYLKLGPTVDKTTASFTLPDIGLKWTWKVKELTETFSDYLGRDTCQDIGPPSALQFGKMKEFASISEDGSTRDLAVLAVLYLYLSILGSGDSAGFPPVNVHLTSDLPTGAGLGSSAAFAVCLSAAFLTQAGLATPVKERGSGPMSWKKDDLDLINRWAFQSERIIHGDPSGIDNAVSTYGGTLRYQGKVIKPLENVPLLNILLINTKIPRSTKVLVAGVREKYEKYPAVIGPVLDSIEGISQMCQSLLEELVTGQFVEKEAVLTQTNNQLDSLKHEPDQNAPIGVQRIDTSQSSSQYSQLEDLIDMNQKFLEILGVSHPALEQLCSLTTKYGLHSKLTGAGGGGCALTLLRPDTKPDTVMQDVDDLFDDDLSAGQVHSVWGSTGHLFVSLNEGLTLRAFDIAPVNQKIAEGKRALIIRQGTSEVIEICVLKKKNAPVYIAHKNGTLKAWMYSDNGGWVHLGNISLCVSQHAQLYAIAVDEGRGRVIWVEGQSNGIQDGCHYSVCTRSMTFESTDVKHSVGPATTLLQNCPKCTLYCSPLAINIWPSDPCPTGLYFTWHSDSYRLKNQLDTHVLGNGRCLSEDRANIVVDFKSAASTLRHIWAQKATQPDLQVVARASHLSSGVLFLISSNGCVHTLNGAKESINALKLPASIDVSQSTGWFAYRFILGAVFMDHVIRILNNTTGELLQELDMSTICAGVGLHVWNIIGAIPRLGIWSNKGIWILQMNNVELLASNMNKSDAVSTLCDFNEERLAALTALQGAYEAYSGQGNEVQGRGPAIPQEGFQNPGLAVSLLQGADANHKPQATQALQSLYEMREEGKVPETRLNDSMRPLLQKYWDLYQQKLSVLDEQSQVTLRPFTVQETISKLVDVSSSMSLNLRRSQMTHLCFRAPMATLTFLLDALKIGKLDENGHITFQTIPLDDDEVDPSLPLVSLAVMAPESESGLPLFEIISRLMFRECPTQLVEFVYLCQRARDKVMDVSAFSRKKSTVQLCDIALGCLPGPDHSKNRDAAVLATAELMQLGAMSHGALHALKLLLRHKLWSHAVGLVQKKSDNTRTHSELFHILLMTLLQEREILPEYYDGLWSCLPQKISSLEFLKLLMTHHQPSNPRIHLCQQVLCRPQDDLQIGMVRDQLIKMLGQEKAKDQ